MEAFQGSRWSVDGARASTRLPSTSRVAISEHLSRTSPTEPKSNLTLHWSGEVSSRDNDSSGPAVDPDERELHVTSIHEPFDPREALVAPAKVLNAWGVGHPQVDALGSATEVNCTRCSASAPQAGQGRTPMRVLNADMSLPTRAKRPTAWHHPALRGSESREHR